MSADAPATFSLRGAQEKLGVSRTVLAGLIADGFVTPRRGARNEYRFTFQDLALLRTAHALQRAGVAPRKILASLAKLKAALPAELPLTGLRITAVGSDVAVRDQAGTLETVSGQLLLDFEVAGEGSRVAFLDRREARALSPAEWVRRGESQEAAGDLAAAEAAYRQALALAADTVDAYLNLGAMWCESGRCAEAVALYDEAVAACADTASLWFNRAIALEEQQRFADAMESYERSLSLDPGLADAHFNLGRLLEQLGERRGALRHFNAYRRLTP